MNKANLLLILFITVSMIVKSQVFSIVNQGKGKEYYQDGTRMLEMGRYEEADSLLTLAMNSYRNENVYYNRGISKLLRKDTSGFCLDMMIAADQYYDIGARRLFNSNCCLRVDTIYYDTRFLPADSSSYKYLEEIQFIRNQKEVKGTIHERNRKEAVAAFSFGKNNRFISFEQKITDIIAIYTIIDSTKYYVHTTSKPEVEKVTAWDNIKEDAKTYFQIKYKKLKEENNVETIIFYFNMKISKTGEIIEVKYLDVYPAISVAEYKNEIEKDIQDIIKHYPRLKPAKFKSEKVNSIASDSIEF